VTQQTVFVVSLAHPTRRITALTATILVLNKWTWAEVDFGHRRRRYLLGASAFFTRKSAERCKLGLLRKLASQPVLMSVAPGLWDCAHKQLAEFKTTGLLN
jgi:hypothetical protein